MTELADAAERVSPRPRLPHPAVRPLVDSYHGYDFELLQPGVHRGLPSSVVTVVLAFGQRLDVGWFDDAGSRDRYWSVASGLHTIPAEIHHDGLQCGIQLSLTAVGARVIFGMPMSALAAEIVPLDAVLPAPLRPLHERLADSSSWAERYDRLDAALCALVSAPDDPPAHTPRTELSWAWDRIVRSGGRAQVAPLAHELGWSRRHLSGQFRAEFGLSPKQLARVTRFERSRELVARRAPLAEVAFACGFADQAHLTREWRAMSGYTPLQWLRAEFPFLQDVDQLSERP
jgi:AraC-like DNA-binding protein